jgi:hypothetical protein
LRRSLSIWLMLCASLQAGSIHAQTTEEVETGNADFAGKSLPYHIRRLPLSSFPELPTAVRKVLEDRQCTVPQTYEARRPENVIHGEFWQKGSRDWAVLCSREGATSLLVFRANAFALPIELESARDLDHLQTRLNGTLGFAWGLDLALPDSVRRMAGSKFGPFDHDGIQVSVVEKSSEIHYCQNGKWLQFDGLD